MVGLIKRIGDAHGIAIAEPKQMIPSGDISFGGGNGDYGSSISKSQAWSLWLNTINALGKADQPDDLEAFINTYAILPWIYVGVWIITTSLASRPLQIFRGKGNKAELIEDDEVNEILTYKFRPA